MAEDPVSRNSNVQAFFQRCGLPPATQGRCVAFVRERFPGMAIEEVRSQGYCSYTLCVEQDTIVQFRPLVHKLEIRLARVARDIYGNRAPQTELLGILADPQSSAKDARGRTEGGALIDEAIAIDDEDEHESDASLYVYSLSRIPGSSLAEVLASERNSPVPQKRLQQQREAVIEQFANFIATGWRSARPASDPIVNSLCGKVGGSIRWRLEAMEARLPRRFRPAVQQTLGRLGEIMSLPWALTHGDVVPANVMVRRRPPSSQDDRCGTLVVTGVLDWAEAEYLPFGVGLYGLEEFLGEAGAHGHFAYYAEAKDLRALFWSKLASELPDLNIKPGTMLRKAVEAAHILGMLLWHGIAFDDGRLDRVVEVGKDDEELWRLDMLLSQLHDEDRRD